MGRQAAPCERSAAPQLRERLNYSQLLIVRIAAR